MGFERILSVLQGQRSNYDTDLFTPIFARIEPLCGRRYGATMEPADIAFRVIADHVRAVTSAISDGASPSNEGRGYVLRRLIRRASRFGRQNLGLKEPFLCQVVPAVAEVLGGTFPEMKQRAAHVAQVLRAEEEQFGRTLDRGLVLFAELATKVGKSGSRTLPGDQAFELYATYGFPQDLVELMAREQSLTLDVAAWNRAMEKHQAASRSEGKFKQLLSAEQLTGVPKSSATYHTEGARSLELDTKVQALFREPGKPDRLVLAETPFYAESGGQIGDTGRVRALDGSFAFVVEDTQKVGEVFVHVGRVEGTPPASVQGLTVRATVDRERRDATRANHTATHLLHKVLKEVLGEHVQQMGSYVGPDRLRFDFSNPQGLTPEQLEEIERRVNAAITRNDALKTTVEELEAAKARGVVALFGEKYADQVRVVDVGGWSTELCGGTHVRAAGDIGAFVIVSERAIQAGVRRLEALTRRGALEWMQEQRRLVQGAARALKTGPEEIGARIEALQKELKEARKKSEQSSAGGVAAAFEQLKAGLKTERGVQHGVFVFESLDQKSLRELADRAKGLAPALALCLLGQEQDKVFHLHIVQGVAPAAGLEAGKLAALAKGFVGGGGGGSPSLAQGQGTNPAGLAAARDALAAALAAGLARL
jgi:alanyl-tRNA synthetase